MIIWRKSSYSGSGAAGGQDCVEVARLAGTVGVRDSKAPEAGHLSITREAFAVLVARLKRDEPDR
ncbi:DUF397 domain-containing protein [Actinomadura sp. NEAU-AAG7]|uniref:DUF397 domain-containing protein n=1 Tax=Actinomadura sp. NEAU-AAG7 TaxID=2839640 RepID=UPI001BE406EE|nr:DUF397 domain-containing protein [Actinomadura sp. NEAU-AAG7]MBT2206767.1 DUF397 domain-containing protein [Actinomadura sp. NEAU-AAG7]